MRLLNTTTRELETFNGPGQDVPPYAILSHTWGQEEVLFKDMKPKNHEAAKGKAGYNKIEKVCIQALRDGYGYIWIDTCCIDKSSSAELSEAINSMFEWYRCSNVCYAYLADVSAGDSRSFVTSRWFRRGWTLQELIAPDKVNFFEKDWHPIGDRRSWASQISDITSIDMAILIRKPVHGYFCLSMDDDMAGCMEMCKPKDVRLVLAEEVVATKMSWAAYRKTTRPEDLAYCLMGLFEVNIPLLYGEGTKAFARLQKEIIRGSSDHSILCWRGSGWGWWGDNEAMSYAKPLLASSPFGFYTPIEKSWSNISRRRLVVTPYGLELSATLCPCDGSVQDENAPEDGEEDKMGSFYLAILDCYADRTVLKRPAMILLKQNEQDSGFSSLGVTFVSNHTASIRLKGKVFFLFF
jgi:hypothetical protein